MFSVSVFFHGALKANFHERVSESIVIIGCIHNWNGKESNRVEKNIKMKLKQLNDYLDLR